MLCWFSIKFTSQGLRTDSFWQSLFILYLCVCARAERHQAKVTGELSLFSIAEKNHYLTFDNLLQNVTHSFYKYFLCTRAERHQVEVAGELDVFSAAEKQFVTF